MAKVVEEWRFSGTPCQLGAIVSTLAEIRTDIVFRVSPKSDGRVRIDFTRQVDFAEPRDRIIAQGWAIVQPLPSQNSVVLLFALSPNKHWLYLSPVWEAVVTEAKRQGWTIEKVTPGVSLWEEARTIAEQDRSVRGHDDTAVAPTENIPQQDLKPVINNIYVGGDYVGGDKIGGDKVGGDKTTADNIPDSTGFAVGTGASANKGIDPQDKDASNQ